MHHLGSIAIAVSILVCFVLQAHGADKYTDENRPYEFGFDVEIDGSRQQHRHEKKDKDGIIMGEFGFVTADDVYHVTVYATDKEGRFKILSMKNIHLKSSPGAGAALSARQGHSLTLPAAPASSAAPAVQTSPVPTSPPQTPIKPFSLEPPGRSCSSCSIPTTTRVPPPAPPASFLPPNQQAYPASPASGLPNNVQQGGFGNQPSSPQGGSPNYSQQGPAVSPAAPNSPAAFPPNNAAQGGFGNQPFSPQVGTPNYSQQGPAVPPRAQAFPQQASGQPQPGFPGSPSSAPIPNAPSSYAQSGPSPPAGQTPTQYGQQDIPQYPDGQLPLQNSPPQSEPASRTSKQYTGPEQPSQPGSVKPTLVSAQMQIVDKNTDIHALRPGEKQGLPTGLSTDDMTQLLYTFNYTVGFHGHFEEGYRNGAKKGYYFVTGRNGVRTRIDYTADESGFHPRVSQEVLDLLSDEVPKPETEKDAKYGLKGYEFKWLYYPVDSNTR